MPIKKGESANGTGDVNFAAACMSVGVPLDEERPVMAIKSDNGQDYGRFFLCGLSIDGRVTLTNCQKVWSSKIVPSGIMEGFGYVVDFLKTRPGPLTSSAEWFDWAHAYLANHGVKGRWGWPRKLEDIADFVRVNHDNREGHVFAFILNRDLCIHLARKAGENAHLLINRGNNHTLINENTPRFRREQFLRMIG